LDYDLFYLLNRYFYNVDNKEINLYLEILEIGTNIAPLKVEYSHLFFYMKILKRKKADYERHEKTKCCSDLLNNCVKPKIFTKGVVITG